MALTDLVLRWRERAEQLRPYADGAAEAFTRAAAELEEQLQEAADETLSLKDAARASGYSERRLRELVQAGELENVGRKGAPRFRRSSLPRRRSRSSTTSTYDSAAHVNEILGRMKR